MRIIKLKIFPVPVRLHSGYGKLIFVIVSPFSPIFNNVVHSLEPGETPRLQTMHSVFKYIHDIAKQFKTVAVRLRLIFQFNYVQYCTSWCTHNMSRALGKIPGMHFLGVFL